MQILAHCLNAFMDMFLPGGSQRRTSCCTQSQVALIVAWTPIQSSGKYPLSLSTFPDAHAGYPRLSIAAAFVSTRAAVSGWHKVQASAHRLNVLLDIRGLLAPQVRVLAAPAQQLAVAARLRDVPVLQIGYLQGNSQVAWMQ